MNTDKKLSKLIDRAILEKDPSELALGYLRYEELRKFNPQKFKQLHAKNIDGYRFDDMVDLVVVGEDFL